MKNAIHALLGLGNIEKQSLIYETAPYGFTEQPSFLNAVVLLDTKLELTDLHKALKNLEKKLGRTRREKWHEREIDFDILFFDDVIIRSEELTVPHSEIEKRSFVLVPLAEIGPEFTHPVLKKTIAGLLGDLEYTARSIYPYEDSGVGF